MSLEKKVSIGMFAAFTGIGCTENTTKLGGVTISEAVTDSDGKAYFTEEETGEEVEVYLTIDKTDFPVADAAVLYFDHPDFKAFSINHPAFAPQLNIALHNSEHLYSLTPAPLQILHLKPKPEKEHSKPAGEAYLYWAKSWKTSGWIHTGCLNRKELVTLMKPGVFLMKILDVLETIGFSEDDVDDVGQYLEENLPESAVADLYVFIPYQHGFMGSTTTITALDVKFSGGCSYENSDWNQSGSNDSYTESDDGDNNNSDGNVGSDCSGTLFCDEFKGTELNTSKWKVINDAGIEVYGGWLSLPSASSIATWSGLENACKDKGVELRAAPYLGSVYVGKMGLSANKNGGVLSCGNESKIVSLSGAENGASLYKSGGFLSLSVDGKVTSVPCSEDISYVQLTAGLNDKVEIDYVKVRCN